MTSSVLNESSIIVLYANFMRDAIAKPNFFAAKVVLYVFNEWSEKRFNSFWHLWVTFAVKRSHFLRIQLTFLTTLQYSFNILWILTAYVQDRAVRTSPVSCTFMIFKFLESLVYNSQFCVQSTAENTQPDHNSVANIHIHSQDICAWPEHNCG